MALDALLKRCRAWTHRHLLGTKDLSPKDISLVLDVADELVKLKDAAPLKGKRLFNFFVPPSCDLRDRTLGPWPKKFGRWAAAARERLNAVKQLKIQ